MTLGQILTFAQELLGDDVSRENQLLPLADQIQKKCYKQTGFQAVKFDSTTGRHPFFTTDAADYEYDFPSWARKVLKIYDAELADEERIYYPEVMVSVSESLRKIRFTEDPGTTTEKFRIIGTVTVASISSENNDLLLIPEEDRFPLLVSGLVSPFQPNHPMFGKAAFDEQLLEFQEGLLTGARPYPRETTPKPAFGWRNHGLQVSDYGKG